MGKKPAKALPQIIEKLDPRSQRNFRNLLLHASRRPLGLMLGAGASVSAGLPGWEELVRRVCEYFLCHWEITPYNRNKMELRSPSNISIALVGDSFTTKLTSAVTRALLESEPAIIAQMIKNCVRPIDWVYLVKRAIYRCNTNGDLEVDTGKSKLLNSIAALCAVPNAVRGVMNYNFDSLLSEYLTLANVPHNNITVLHQKISKSKINIWHPHGCLPRQGGENTPLVFTEEEYQAQGAEPYFWANIAQLGLLVNAPCVFIGASMTDANMRRLLWSTTGSVDYNHFAFLPRESRRTDQQWMCDTLFDDDLKRLNVKIIRFAKQKRSNDPYGNLLKLLAYLTHYIKSFQTGSHPIYFTDDAFIPSKAKYKRRM